MDKPRSVGDSEFMAIWNLANDLQEVADKLCRSKDYCRQRATRIRRKGLALKKRPRHFATISSMEMKMMLDRVNAKKRTTQNYYRPGPSAKSLFRSNCEWTRQCAIKGGKKGGPMRGTLQGTLRAIGLL